MAPTLLWIGQAGIKDAAATVPIDAPKQRERHFFTDTRSIKAEHGLPPARRHPMRGKL